jgi:hypothetical protein
MTVRPRRFRPVRLLREDLWGRLLLSPRLRFLPLLLAATRSRRPPRYLVRPLLPPPVPFRGRRPRPPSPYSRALRARRLVGQIYQLFNRRRLQRLVACVPSTGLLGLLESFPIPLLVRSLLVRSPAQARQLLAHGRVLVEGSFATPFSPVRPGQLLQLLDPVDPPLRYRGGVTVRLSPPPGPPAHLEVSLVARALILLFRPQPGEVFQPAPFSLSSLFALLRR